MSSRASRLRGRRVHGTSPPRPAAPLPARESDAAPGEPGLSPSPSASGQVALITLGAVAANLPFVIDSLWWIALLAPIPWMLVVDAQVRAGRGAWHSALALGGGQLLLHAIGLRWLTETGISMWLSGASYGAAFGVVLGLVLSRCRSRLGWRFAALGPLAWNAVEVLKAESPLFPTTWMSLGNAFSGAGPLAQVAEWTGIFGLSALALFFAGACADGLIAARDTGVASWRRRTHWLPVAAAGAALAAATAAGAARLGSIEVSDGPRVALVQGNIPVAASLDRSKVGDIFETHAALSRSADREDVLLVAWSESTMRLIVERDAEWWRSVSALSEEIGVPILFGAIGLGRYPAGDEAPTNSAYLAGSGGRVIGRWDKRVLVPPAETLPVIGVVPALRRSVGGFFRRHFGFFPFLVPGKAGVVARAGEDAIPVGAMICYDDTLSGPSRDLRDAGARILFVLSNEAWFGDAEHGQHLAMARFRAIETRLPLVRATNSGTSAFIDPAGRVHARIPENAPGTLTAAVKETTAAPPPAWVPAIFRWGFLAAGIALLVLAWRRSRG